MKFRIFTQRMALALSLVYDGIGYGDVPYEPSARMLWFDFDSGTFLKRSAVPKRR